MDKERREYAKDIFQADQQIIFLRKSLIEMETKANEDLDQALKIYKEKLNFLSDITEELRDTVNKAL